MHPVALGDVREALDVGWAVGRRRQLVTLGDFAGFGEEPLDAARRIGDEDLRRGGRLELFEGVRGDVEQRPRAGLDAQS